MSAADEARAAWHESRGEDADAESFRRASDMDSLRGRLRDMIERESGRKHVADIAATAHSMVGPLATVVRARLREERAPVDKVAEMLKEHEAAFEKADEALSHMRSDLERQQKSRVRAAARPFRGLAKHLHEKLDDEIGRTDIRDKRAANGIGVTRTNVLQQWLEAPGGPADLWREELGKFKQDIDGWMRRNLHEDRSAAGTLSIADFNVEDYVLSPKKRRRTEAHDIVQRTAAVLGIAAPAAATATWIAGTVAAGVLIPPAGAVAGAAALVIVGVHLFRNRLGALDALQREWIADLDALAAGVGDHFTVTLGTEFMKMIDAALDVVEDYRTQIDESVSRLQTRFTDSEFKGHQEIIDQLTPLDREGQEVVATLEGLMASREP